MKGYLLGIDIGTSSVKAAIYSTNFALVSEGSKEYQTYCPKTGWAEQSADRWWDASVLAIRECLKSCNVDAKDIKGICVSSHAPSLVPIDSDGSCVRNALIWMDRRSEKQCSEIREVIGQERIVAVTGNRIDPYFLLGKWMWYRDNEPENHLRTHKILQANGFINFKLTGQHSIDKVHASLAGMLDIHSGKWSKEILTRLKLDEAMLPDIYISTDIIGVVNEQASKITGLAVGTPVVAGNVDASSSALESGVVGDGKAVDMTGSSTVLMIGSNRWRNSSTLVSMHHPVKNSSLIFGPISSTGASLKWFNQQMCGAENIISSRLKMNPYELLTMEAEQVKAGSDNLIFLPYLAGERSPIWDTYAKGVFFGLDFNTTKSHMIRAILEGTSFALKHNIEEAEKMGLEINELRAVGGGSNSELWLKIKASITNKPVVTIKKASSGAFGNILLAGAGVGIFDDIEDILNENIKIKEVFEPDEKLHLKYDRMYEIYKSIYTNVKQDMRRLAELEDM